MKKILKLGKFVFLSTAFAACVNSSESQNKPQPSPDSLPKTDSTQISENTKANKAQAPKEFDKKYDASARFLAGMSLPEGYPYVELTQNADWKQLAQRADASWAKGETERFATMKNWVEQSLKEANNMSGDLFYPFSGPDAFHAYTFFPSADNYHLFALEPAGNLPLLDGVSPKESVAYCQTVQKAINDFFNSSFFYTIHMAQQIPAASGAAPVLCVFLTRTGNTIVKVEPVDIQADGSLQVIPAGKHTSVRIEFIDGKTQALKTLTYHSCDISDEGLVKRPALLAHLEKVSQNRTFTKSASYLMHRPTFAKVRDLILKNAKLVLQDDTGVPYKYYVENNWNPTFFGKYYAPIALFKDRVQLDLREAYTKGSPQPLPFTMGYHSRNQQDNVMLFTRK